MTPAKLGDSNDLVKRLMLQAGRESADFPRPMLIVPCLSATDGFDVAAYMRNLGALWGDEIYKSTERYCCTNSGKSDYFAQISECSQRKPDIFLDPDNGIGRPVGKKHRDKRIDESVVQNLVDLLWNPLIIVYNESIKDRSKTDLAAHARNSIKSLCGNTRFATYYLGSNLRAQVPFVFASKDCARISRVQYALRRLGCCAFA